MLLGDKFGYPSGISHGLTTYYLNVVPHLSREVDLTVCLLREPHPAARELNSAGIEPVFFNARRWNPFVALQVAALAKQRGCRIIHAGGIKAALVARAVARLLEASVLVHVHDEKIPPASIRFLHRVFARPTDLGICVSRAVSENAHGSYYLARNRLRIVHNGVELERFAKSLPTRVIACERS
jgi:glycosyltransferase involved in cell wall biosynthesis